VCRRAAREYGQGVSLLGAGGESRFAGPAVWEMVSSLIKVTRSTVDGLVSGGVIHDGLPQEECVAADE
jgi:hypothetical protein